MLYIGTLNITTGSGLKTPCKDCDKRKFNCHSDCNDYIAFKIINQEFIDLKHKSIEIFTNADLDKKLKNSRCRASRRKRKYVEVGRC